MKIKFFTIAITAGVLLTIASHAVTLGTATNQAPIDSLKQNMMFA